MINWDEAPEGTTHGTDEGGPIGSFGPWRKLEKGVWYNYRDGKWRFRSDAKDYLQNNPHLVERPAPVEAELPDGKVWPEGMTHYSPKIGGLFFNEKVYIYSAVPTPWMPGQFEAWAEFDDTIKRFPGKQIAKKEDPPKKRAVGWWA